MKFFLIAFVFLIFFSHSSMSQIEQGKWNYVKEPDLCYIGSAPEIIDIPEGKKRGDTYILVYRINKSKNAIIQIVAGYPFKAEKKISVLIDSGEYSFYTEENTAWTEEDSKVILAMKKGMQLIVNGVSSRGTKTSDIYTLKGFTVAFNKLFENC
jgi:hypothetical protein|tara:strand:+ start:199 stop:660 length:462 start_codon:yes stop_codon:yes gene_type:complete